MADAFSAQMEQDKARMYALFGENRKIEDGSFDESLAVRCVNGTFVGKREDGVIVHKGIPFAAPPVGGLRGRAPGDAERDDGVYEAYDFGHVPRQSGSGSQIGSLYPQDEDCLFLNVWTADGGLDGKKPVMVWIHGGAFEIGGTTEPREEGCAFVRENPGVVRVSMEYRMGPFGFIHLSHLADGADYPDAQNLGLMDQLQALRWVHENIAGFGGDPANVTIFGQSAGGGSVSLLPLVKGARAYFNRVIAQSGSPSLCQSTEQAIAGTNRLMEALGVDTVAELGEVDTATILATASAILGMRTAPERDGDFLPTSTWQAYAEGAAKDFDIMCGCTKDEFHYFSTGWGVEGFAAWADERKAEKMAQLTDEEKALVESFCADVNVLLPFERSSRLLDQIWFNAPAIRTAEEQTRAGGRAFAYYSTVEATIPLMRSGHAIELSTLFNHAEETSFTGKEFDATFGKIMRRMWVQFAKCGDPSLSAELSPDGKERPWPVYNTEDKPVMVFDEFNVRAEPEAKMGVVDWDRTYFLTDYYVL